MQVNLPVSILAGCGLWFVFSLIATHYSRITKILYCVFGVGALCVAAYQFVSKFVVLVPHFYPSCSIILEHWELNATIFLSNPYFRWFKTTANVYHWDESSEAGKWINLLYHHHFLTINIAWNQPSLLSSCSIPGVLNLKRILVAQRRNYRLCDMSNNYLMRDFGRKLLDAVPSHGVLFLKGDVTSIPTT